MSESIDPVPATNLQITSARVIAASLALIALILGYNQLASSMLGKCKATALSGRLTVYAIEDVKWTPVGCRFLSHWKRSSDGTSMGDEAEWRSENEVFMEGKR